MNVLVTGAGALVGQGVIRALKHCSLKPRIIAADPSPLAAGLYWVDESYLIPMVADPNYIDRVRTLLDRLRPDVVLVGTDIELPIFAQYRDELEKDFSVKILVSSPEVVAIADDKFLTYQFLKNHQFDYPQTCLPEGADTLVQQVGFPLIVKPRVGARSVGVTKVYDQHQLRQALQSQPQAIVQEYVASDADEYTAGAICFDGVCMASIVMRRDLKDGNTYRAFVEQDPHLNAVVQAIATALRPNGPVNLQFRLDGDRVKVFEMNARFSGTTWLRTLAGFNEVELCLRHLLFGEPVIQPSIQPLAFLRHWCETVISLDDCTRVKAL